MCDSPGTDESLDFLLFSLPNTDTGLREAGPPLPPPSDSDGDIRTLLSVFFRRGIQSHLNCKSSYILKTGTYSTKTPLLTVLSNWAGL